MPSSVGGRMEVKSGSPSYSIQNKRGPGGWKILMLLSKIIKLRSS